MVEIGASASADAQLLFSSEYPVQQPAQQETNQGAGESRKGTIEQIAHRK